MSSGSASTAHAFIDELRTLSSAVEREKIHRYFKTGAGDYGEGDYFLGVRMGQVFALASRHPDMSLNQLEELLESPVHEARAGAVKIMAKQAAGRSATDHLGKELFDLYLRRIDRINNWDLVDLGAWDVVGRYLSDKPRGVLDGLARSENLWERRTAILATLHVLRRGEVEDMLRYAIEHLEPNVRAHYRAVRPVPG